MRSKQRKWLKEERNNSSMNKFKYSLAIVITVFIASTPNSGYSDSFGNGANFLISNQRADGSWVSNETHRTHHVTSEALLALHGIGSGEVARTSAADYLVAYLADDMDALARSIKSLSAEGRDVIAAVDKLLAASDPQGGWGITSDYSADPIDTALALIALSTVKSSDVNLIYKAISFIVASQNQDGGWGCVRDGPSDISCTAQVLIALNSYREQFSLDAIASIVSAQNFLKDEINYDGSIGGVAADPIYTTALAARALIESGDELGDDRLSIISYLENEQSGDGSWEGDPLFTAVAIRALFTLINVPICGDDVINQDIENCDGIDLGGSTCESIGFDGGILSCNSGCKFNTSECTVIDNPPVITSSPVIVATEGQLYSYDIEAIDPNGELSASKIYWSELSTSAIYRANMDGSDIEDVVTGQAGPFGIALDPVGGKIYWTNIYSPSTIRRSNMDGSNMEILVDNEYSFGITLDIASSKMYWTGGSNVIKRAYLDGTDIENIIIYSNVGIISLRGIALDLSTNKIYWPTMGSPSTISRSSLDGTDIEPLVTTGLRAPFDIALDLENGKMYWVDDSTGKIQRANLDGSDIEDILTGQGRMYSIALDLSVGKMYWSSFFYGIRRANLDGTNIENVVSGRYPRDIALQFASVAPLNFSLDVAPAGMIISEETGLIEWTPDSSQVGDHTVTVRVEDADELFDTQSFTVSVTSLIEAPDDNDGDGFPGDVDCDDTDPNVNPSVGEVPGNDIDDDCNPGTSDIITSEDIVCTVTTDKITYGAREQIRVDTILNRTEGFGSLAGLKLSLDVEAIGDILEPITALAPDERRQLSHFFSTNATPPGAITINAQILSGTDIITSCSAITNIASSADEGLGLIGSITADPPVAFYGDDIAFGYNVENAGNVAFEPANLKILIVDPTSGDVEMMLTDSVSLNPGGTYNSTQLISQDLAVGEYLVILQGGSDSNLESLASTALSVQESPNQPPEAMCQNITVPNGPETCLASASVNNGSFDPDGDPITLVQLPAGPYNLGTTNVTLTVTDDKDETDQCSATVTVVDQEAPAIVCQNPQEKECSGPDGTAVSFNATVTDNCTESPTVNCDPVSGSLFPLGPTSVTCTANDESSNSSSCDFTVTVEDTTDPVISSVSASPNVLWPPNHKMKTVTVTVEASDACVAEPNCQINSVESNEPVNGTGDGDTEPDWVITGDLKVDLRAERSGTGDGRIYTITVGCTDELGNTSTSDVTVSVPHDKGKKK